MSNFKGGFKKIAVSGKWVVNRVAGGLSSRAGNSALKDQIVSKVKKMNSDSTPLHKKILNKITGKTDSAPWRKAVPASHRGKAIDGIKKINYVSKGMANSADKGSLDRHLESRLKEAK